MRKEWAAVPGWNRRIFLFRFQILHQGIFPVVGENITDERQKKENAVNHSNGSYKTDRHPREQYQCNETDKEHRCADFSRCQGPGEHLPEQVGINLQATGEFATMISRTMAVNGPLMLTFGCLLMMFFSRKALYSWAISIFTLVLPILLLVSNLYPA